MKRSAVLALSGILLAGSTALASAQTTVRVAWCAKTVSSAAAPFAIATKMGWYKEAGIKVELVPKEDGKAYELVARLDEPPATSVSGLLYFETSVAAQSRIEVPVIVNVLKP